MSRFRALAPPANNTTTTHQHATRAASFAAFAAASITLLRSHCANRFSCCAVGVLVARHATTRSLAASSTSLSVRGRSEQCSEKSEHHSISFSYLPEELVATIIQVAADVRRPPLHSVLGPYGRANLVHNNTPTTRRTPRDKPANDRAMNDHATEPYVSPQPPVPLGDVQRIPSG